MKVDVLADNPRELSEERLKIRDEARQLIITLGAQRVADVVELPQSTVENTTTEPLHIEVA